MTQEQSSKRSIEFLDTLSVPQLRQLLRAEFEADGADVELIRNITTVLASKEDVNQQDIDIDAAYKTFVDDYSQTEPLFGEVLDELDEKTAHAGSKKPRRFRFVKIAAAVLAVILVFGALAATASGVNIWTVFTKWTEEIFGYTSPESDEELKGKEQRDEYYLLQQALEQNNVFQQVVPNYLPSDYCFEDLSLQDTYEGTSISGLFTNGNSFISFAYIISDTTPNLYYTKDEDAPEVYVINGIEHYITINEGKYRATWLNGNVLCRLSGVEPKEEIIKVIDSIYLEE